ncbi:MAG: hypothetical protein KDD49_07125 [Bacteroidetes bacterium]|nr:hypothetical protein [Bacteroidota bacterium]
MMRKFFFLLIFITFVGQLSRAQTPKTYSTTAPEFRKELETTFANSLSDKTKEIYKQFEKNIAAGMISDAQLEKLAALFNVMLEKKMTPSPYLDHYLLTLNGIMAKGENAGDWLNQWNEVSQKLALQMERAKNARFKTFLDFSSAFWNDSLIYESPARDWGVHAQDFTMKWENDLPVMEFQQTDLFGFTKKDTIFIAGTSGKLNVLESKWTGKKGKVNWLKTKGYYSNAFAELADYKIDLTQGEYAAENVKFTFDKFFKTPLEGTFVDKLTNPVGGDYDYPRFESYKHDIKIDAVTKNVLFTGGFGLWGNKVVVLGTKEKKAEADFFHDDGKVVLKSFARLFGLRNQEEINASQAEVSLYFANDSIFHPSLTLSFKIPTQHLRLVRDEKATSQIAFMDSYHNLEIKTDVVDWKLNEPSLSFQKLLRVEQDPVEVESYDYFEKAIIEKYLTTTNQNPVAVLRTWYESTRSNQISGNDFAKYFQGNYNTEIILNVIYDLIADGFIYYDPPTDMITIRDKAIHFANAAKKEGDYDNLRFISKVNDDNLVLDLQNYAMDIRGVERVALSDSQSVVLFPYNKEFTVKKGRDMEMFGDVVSGRADLIGGQFKVNYDEFSIEVDSTKNLLLYVPSKEQYTNTDFVKTEPIKTLIHNVSGKLYIDDPQNKSGLEKDEQYPKFESSDFSYVYYDQKDLYNGAYARDRFFFKLNPFTIEGMDDIPPNKLNFPGLMVFGDIFPEVEETINVQEDNSFGFRDIIAAANTPLYKGIGTYEGKVNMSNRGLRGDGTIYFEPTTLQVKDCLFLPDSMLVTADNIEVKKGTFHQVSYPEINNVNVKVNWYPYADSMYVEGTKENKFSMYEERTEMFGNLLITNKQGISGRGRLYWDDAELKSTSYHFSENNVKADTADLVVTYPGAKKANLIANKLKTDMEMYNNYGKFERMEDTIPLKFPVMRYDAYADLLDWDRNNATLLVSKKAESDKPCIFISQHPKQDSLRFEAGKGSYDLANEIMHFKEVSQIRVADASIIPFQNEMVLKPDALIETLENAQIVVDTLTRLHNISNALVSIKSSKLYEASGDYVYSSPSLNEQIVRLDNIQSKEYVPTEEELKDKKFKEKYRTNPYFTYAESEIPESQEFQLDDRLRFKGKVQLASQNKFLTFDGFSKLDLRSSYLNSQWFGFKDEINPKNIQIMLNQTVGEANEPLFVGVLFDFFDIRPYVSILDSKHSTNDFEIVPAQGLLAYDSKKQLYRIGDTAKIRDNDLVGNLLTFYDAENKATTEGKIYLGSDFGLVDVQTAGPTKFDLTNNSFILDKVAMKIDFLMDDKLWKAMATDIKELTAENDEVPYVTKQFNTAIVELVKPEEANSVVIKLSQDGYFNLPKDFKNKLFFADITMVWDSLNNSFRSVGDIGLGYMGEDYINRKLKNSYIEFAPRRNNDYFNIYFEMEDPETLTKVWYFIHYSNSVLQLSSSNPQLSSNLASVKEKSRKIEDKKTQKTYQYMDAPIVKMNNFVYRMKDTEAMFENVLEEDK